MRIKSFLTAIVIALSVNLFPISNATSLEIKVAPAGWVSLYASDTGNFTPSVPRVFSANLEKKSNFLPIYNNVPDIARQAVQAAIDIWSETTMVYLSSGSQTLQFPLMDQEIPMWLHRSTHPQIHSQ
jgi:hypothetical protein